MGSSCFSRGNKTTLPIIKTYLKERLLDEKVVFRGAHCTGNCDKGPVLVINGNSFTEVTPDKIADLLDKQLANEKNIT